MGPTAGNGNAKRTKGRLRTTKRAMHRTPKRTSKRDLKRALIRSGPGTQRPA